ncbi:MAG: YczE/YyaS/YitT family protein [Sphingomonadales bacterium]
MKNMSKESLKVYFATPLSWSAHQIIVYTCGIFLFSLGAKGFIDAKLGTDPLDVLVIGMTLHLPFQIGTCSSIVAIVFLLWWTIWNKKIPPISPFVSTAAVGYLIDFWNAVQLEQITIKALPIYHFTVAQTQLNGSAILLVVVSLLCCSYASALIIMSGIGIRIMDLVGITMIEKWGWSFFRAKMLLEVLLFTSGWLLGGPMGFTTIAFLFLVGPFIQPFMWLNTKYFGMSNYGIR